MRYELPVLETIGDADDVILGIFSWGDDIDGFLTIADFEWQQDPDAG